MLTHRSLFHVLRVKHSSSSFMCIDYEGRIPTIVDELSCSTTCKPVVGLQSFSASRPSCAFLHDIILFPLKSEKLVVAGNKADSLPILEWSFCRIQGRTQYHIKHCISRTPEQEHAEDVCHSYSNVPIVTYWRFDKGNCASSRPLVIKFDLSLHTSMQRGSGQTETNHPPCGANCRRTNTASMGKDRANPN